MGNTISYTETSHTLSLGDHGVLIGTSYTSKSDPPTPKAVRYAGIRYGHPPLGHLRFAKPLALPSNHVYKSSDSVGDDDSLHCGLRKPFDATQFHPPCYQTHFKAEAEASAVYSEDCLRLNIWTPHPSISPPTGGWPVYVWLHGGWMQMGDASQEPGMSPIELISSGGLDAIVVAVGYRLNVFGFLSGAALAEEEQGEGKGGNYGLWDQRCALEWVQRWIAYFGGKRSNVTLAGRSAGAYGVHAQILYDWRRDDDEQKTESEAYFHRAFMCSNAIPAQPKTVQDTQEQWNELCTKLDIGVSLSATQQLKLLRKVSPERLTEAIRRMQHHTFRPVTDGVFIKDGLVDYHTSGSFARDFTRRKFRFLIGEVANEETLYATYNAPTEPTSSSLRIQLENYYAPAAVDRILNSYPLPSSTRLEDWCALFGRIVADGQVRAPSRLLADSLLTHGASATDVWRYQIAYRLSFITEKVAPQSMGVAHAMDKPIWNYSIMHGPNEKEAKLMKEWIGDLVALVQDEKGHEYGTRKAEDVKVMTSEGKIEVREDKRYRELIELARTFCGAYDNVPPVGN